MRRFALILVSALAVSSMLAACGVPAPPPELPTATPGSLNPESAAVRANLTQVPIAPEKGFTPLAAPAGLIYFVRDSKLWRISPDGTGEVQLSDLPVTNPPQPSPDGSLLAFTSGQSLYVMPSTGGTPRKLVNAALTDGQKIGWSPDNSLVAYIAADISIMGKEQAWAVPVEGGQPTLITDLPTNVVGLGPVYERIVQWSPDGKWVVVAGQNNPMLLLRWPLAAGGDNQAREIAGGEPNWSPNSQDIIYTETLSGGLNFYEVIQSDATPVPAQKEFVGTGLTEYAQGPEPQWSPASSGSDSDLIAYRSKSDSGQVRVAISTLGGQPQMEPLPALTNNPSWSPGGDQLVVETGRMQNDPLGPKWVANGLAIAKLNLNPGGQHTMKPLTQNAQWPVWGKSK